MQAQLTGGGKKENVKKGGSTEKDVFDNSFYWTFSRASATGNFALNANNYEDFIKGKGGMGKGVGTSIGSIFYLNSIDFNDQIKVGIDVTYLSWVMLFDPYEKTAADASTHFFSMKVGPLVSYNPTDRLLIDMKVTLQPTSVIYINTFKDGYDEYGEKYKYVLSSGSKLRFGLGLNVRYRPFTLGFEISSGKTTLKDLESDEKLTKIPTGRFDLVLGFSF
jgi:hypothetical protein